MMRSKSWLTDVVLVAVAILLERTTVQGFVIIRKSPIQTKRLRVSSELNMAVSKATKATTTITDAFNKEKSLLVGHLASNLSKFSFNPNKARAVKSAVSQTVNGPEVLLIAFFGWALLPIVRFIYNQTRGQGQEKVDFQDTSCYRVSQLIGQAAQIAGLVYCLDVLTVFFSVLGFNIPKGFNVACAKIMYLLWAAYRLVKYKKDLLIRKRGKAGSIDKVIDAVIGIVTVFGVFDVLGVHFGLTMNSLLTLGGAASLAVSLGSQNLASQVVNGLAIASTGKFYVDEKIVIVDNGKQYVGTVEDIKLMAMDIRTNDEVVLNVPNKDLARRRVGNITRSKWSAVTQTIWFNYEDIEKVPKVCEDIKRFIKVRCPTVEENDSSRLFRATISALNRHVEVEIEAHFRLPPFSNAYYENRQNVMRAVSDAAYENGITFDIPAVTVEAEGSDLSSLSKSI